MNMKGLPLPVFAAFVLLASGCVTTANDCGNEQRDWAGLTFPKGDYCTLPSWMPLKSHYEAANKGICKVHDNNTGRASLVSYHEADTRFLCDYVKRSELPWGVRHVTGYASYVVVRSRSIQRARKRSAGLVAAQRGDGLVLPGLDDITVIDTRR